MSSDNYFIKVNKEFDRYKLNKGLWIVINNATRIPPHIGLLFNGQYSSLNIKGIEKDIDITILLRTIEIQGTKSIFVKLKDHPVFSIDFLCEHFLHELEKFEKVSSENTCFKPVRSFFQENYVLWNIDLDYLFKLFPPLYENNMIDCAMATNMSDIIENGFYNFVPYTNKEIADKLNEIKRMQVS